MQYARDAGAIRLAMNAITPSRATGLLLGFVTVWMLHTCALAQNRDLSEHKVLLIGVDGLQLEKLDQAILDNQAPVLEKLIHYQSYTGGITNTTTQQATLSGPGWTTVLTGTWADRHKIIGNDNLLRVRANSLFRMIRQSSPTRHSASIVSWNSINDNFAEDLTDGSIELGVKCGGDDQCVVERTVEELHSGNFDFIFAHIDQPDGIGHQEGFGVQYQKIIATVDAQIGQILAALDTRKKDQPDEDWLVMVVTDHGRRSPEGDTHGGQSLSEKTTFIAIDKPANAQLTRPITNPINPDYDGLYGYASMVDVAPTVLAHLGIEIDPAAYAMDGVPLIGPLGVRQLTASLDRTAHKVVLRWRTTPGNKHPLVIFRSGQKIAQLTDSSNEYIDNDLPSPMGNLNYTVELNDVSVSRLVKP
jgi:membrane-anchored protein YejM (alkaline phosphatase superfamily)